MQWLIKFTMCFIFSNRSDRSKNACYPDGGHSQNPSKKSQITGCMIQSDQIDLASIFLTSERIVCGYIKAEYAEQNKPQKLKP